jgi:hypothetical protein
MLEVVATTFIAAAAGSAVARRAEASRVFFTFASSESVRAVGAERELELEEEAPPLLLLPVDADRGALELRPDARVLGRVEGERRREAARGAPGRLLAGEDGLVRQAASVPADAELEARKEPVDRLKVGAVVPGDGPVRRAGEVELLLPPEVLRLEDEVAGAVRAGRVVLPDGVEPQSVAVPSRTSSGIPSASSSWTSWWLRLDANEAPTWRRSSSRGRARASRTP